MAQDFLEKSLETVLDEDFSRDDDSYRDFKDGLKELVTRRRRGDTIKDILHLLTKEELLNEKNTAQWMFRQKAFVSKQKQVGKKISLDPIEIDLFLKLLDEKRREFSAGKIFNDPIHGHMEIHPACVLIINTPQFQRLRYIKQLGMCYFVFPGASHNRFEHSIGTCYLAGQFCRSLRENQPELGITDMDILCVEIAGLCHDLGHGPFSRLFVDRFLPSFADENVAGQSQREYARKHKVPSADMFDFLLEENVVVKHYLESRYKICGKEIDFIKEQINGPPVTGSTAWPYKGRKEHKAYLYEIVSNLRNGIDVCKWDYMARDCHHLGLRNNFDHRRYMKFARVIEESGEHQICLRDKEAGNVYNMFYTRYTLNKYAYKHPANCAIEEMVVDVLKKANDNLSFGREEVVDVLKKAEEHLKIASECVVQSYKDAAKHLKTAVEVVVDFLKKFKDNLSFGTERVDDVLKKAEEDLKIASECDVQSYEVADKHLKTAVEVVIDFLKKVQINPSFGREKVVDVLKKAEEHVKIASECDVQSYEVADKHLKSALDVVDNLLKMAIELPNPSKKRVVKDMKKAKRAVNPASAKVVDVLQKARIDSSDSAAVNDILKKAQEDFNGASKKVVNILKQAQEGLNLGKKGIYMSECHKVGGTDGMRALSELTDDVLYKIRYDSRLTLNDSKEILKRIYERELYTCVYKSDPLDLSPLKDPPNARDIEEKIKEHPSLNDNQGELLFFVQIVHLDFGMKEENPVRRLRFFRKGNLYEARHLPEEEVSRILRPPSHDEEEIRFYSKRTDINKELERKANEYIEDLKKTLQS